MPIKHLNVERFSITSSKSFADVLKAVEKQIGHPDLRKLVEDMASAKSDSELQELVRAAVGPTDLMEFLRLDQGVVLRKELGEDGPQMLRLLVGNPLTMRKMAKFVHDAGSYAPITILIDEQPDGVHLSYDRMASFLASYDNASVMEVAKGLDAAVERVLTTAAN